MLGGPGIVSGAPYLTQPHHQLMPGSFLCNCASAYFFIFLQHFYSSFKQIDKYFSGTSMPSVPFSSQPMAPAPAQQNSSPMQHLISPHLIKLPRELQNSSILHQIDPGQTCVVICYNLPAAEITVRKASHDALFSSFHFLHQLFNLLSLYGVVIRIKLLRDKPDTALAQYSHPLYATLACHYLHGGIVASLRVRNSCFF